MYDFLQSRSRPVGVEKTEIRILAAVARTFFVLRAERGDHNLYEFRKSQAILVLAEVCAPKPFSGKVIFQDLPCESANFFYSTIPVLEWGRLFFTKIIKVHLALQIPI